MMHLCTLVTRFDEVVLPMHFSLNIPAELIKLHGDWKSNAYLRYIDISTDLQWKMVNVMSSHLKG